MAERLKDSFGPEIPKVIAAMIAAVEPEFDGDSFVARCLVGYDELELTARARHISDRLAEHLPSDSAKALDLIVRSLGPAIGDVALQGMEPFRYLPFVYFVADHGIDHFEASMAAQYELTKRFTAEFSIRSFIERYPDETLGRLRIWAIDDNVHVRRLVSEGTRPRLPWAPRLRSFQADPAPVIELLEILKDDPEEYVRRSVANNLNDISKDHPELVVETAARWSEGASPARRRLIRHALRTLIKQGHPGALSVIGYGADSPVRVADVRVEPSKVTIGEQVRIEIDVENPADTVHGALIDVIVHFVKANGSTSPKVFKGSEVMLAGGQTATVSKTVSLRQHTTRTHYPGVHVVEVQVNGSIRPGGSFELSRD
jgi:3-methyladenine DNA glycosylase AlkC